MQATCVIKHIKYNNPDWFVGVEARQGTESVYHGIADAVHILQHPLNYRDNYDKVFFLHWEEYSRSWPNHPSTKVAECLWRYFEDIEPLEQFFRYTLNISDEAQAKADKYITEELPDKPFGLVHYEGVSSPLKKNLSDTEALALCATLHDAGITPVILSWKPNELVDNQAIFGPIYDHWLWNKHTGSADVIAALINRAAIMFGIDSGPEHLAGALDTPTYVFLWAKHPAHCFDLASNITYLVPYDVDCLLKPALDDGERHMAQAYWREKYNHIEYHDGLCNAVQTVCAIGLAELRALTNEPPIPA